MEKRIAGGVILLLIVGGAVAAGKRSDLDTLVRVGDATWSLREDVIDHPHIPVQVVLRPATVAR